MKHKEIRQQFTWYLDEMHTTRERTAQAIATLDPARLQAGKTLAIVWEATYDLALQLRRKPTLRELTAISAIVLKLLQTQHQFLAAETETRELTKPEATPVPALAAGLTPEACAELEKKANFMT